MNFILKVVLIAGLSYLAELFLPWWSIVICAFLVSLIIPTRSLNSFLSGFLGVGLLWLLFAWVIDAQSDSLLMAKVADLLEFSQSAALIAITATIGALVGGFASLSGTFFRRIFTTERSEKYY